MEFDALLGRTERQAMAPMPQAEISFLSNGKYRIQHRYHLAAKSGNDRREYRDVSAPISLPLSGNPDGEATPDQYSRSASPVEYQDRGHQHGQEEKRDPDSFNDLDPEVLSHRSSAAS